MVKTKRASKVKEAKPTKKRKMYTKRSVDEGVTFEIIEGMPETRRIAHMHPELYNKICNTIKALEPGKKHFVMDKKYRHQVLAIAKRDYPKMIVRTAANPDKKTISVWRLQ
jgi:hypothetical protein